MGIPCMKVTKSDHRTPLLWVSGGRVEMALWYLGVVSLSLSVDTTDTTTGNYPSDKVPLP